MITDEGELIDGEEAEKKKKLKEITCFCCRERGHYSSNCPKKDETDKKEWKIKLELNLGMNGIEFLPTM